MKLAPCSQLRHALAQLEARNGDEVHVVRPISQAQRAGTCPQPGKREVVRDAAAAVRLYGDVQNLQHCGGRQHLCRSNLAPRLQHMRKPSVFLCRDSAVLLHPSFAQQDLALYYTLRSSTGMIYRHNSI